MVGAGAAFMILPFTLPALVLAKESRYLVLAALLAAVAAFIFFAMWLEMLDELHPPDALVIGWAGALGAAATLLAQTVSTRTISVSSSALTFSTASSADGRAVSRLERTPLTSTLPTAGTR